MKSQNIQWFIFFSLSVLISGIYSKSFLEAAKDKVQEEFKYDTEEYRNEPASLNHQYYTKRGKEELEQCRNTYSANYDDCRNYKTCNFCSANSGCGWCDEKKICIPLDLNSRKEELIPLCMGDCIKVLKIEYCFKGLFEPDNTQEEINFANYDQVINQDKYAKSPYDPVDLDEEEDTNFENIMEKTLEKNIIESQKIKQDFNYNFMQKKENLLADSKRNNLQDRNINKSFNKNFHKLNSSFKIASKNQINAQSDDLLEDSFIKNSSKFDNKPNNNFLEKSLNLLSKNSSENQSESEAESNLNSQAESEKFESESLETKLSNEFKSNSFEKVEDKELNNFENKKIIESLKPDCDEAKNGVHGVENIQAISNDASLNFIPKSYTNYPNNIDLQKNSQKLYREMAQISKDVFNSLLSKDLKSRKKNNFIKANLDDGPKTEEELLKYLKEFIPNFEFPQYLKSDLEQSINEIKREKLLLWLRGFSLNQLISKIHLPIYQNLSFTNEEQIRKMFLDKFYKDIVKDPYTNINSVIYKNMLGNSGKIISKGDLKQYIGKKPKEIIKDLKVIDSTYIDNKDLMGLVKQSNMRFKEKNENSIGEKKDKKSIMRKKSKIKNDIESKSNNKTKSLKEIAYDLKDFLKNIK